jgi:hypothetical protein
MEEEEEKEEEEEEKEKKKKKKTKKRRKEEEENEEWIIPLRYKITLTKITVLSRLLHLSLHLFHSYIFTHSGEI